MIPLYRSDSYLKKCHTIIDRVLKTEETTTVFCREALFMEGGGQPMDHGSISNGDQEFSLQAIIKEKGNTGFVIDANAKFEKGMTVHCTLDFERRLKIMRLHTAQHALAGSLRLVRESILTGGMKISNSAEECAVVYPTTSGLSESELLQGMQICKKFIVDDKPVTTVTVSSESEAKDQYGALYRPTIASGSLKGNIRLVVIQDVDANACGGTHVSSLKGLEIEVISLNSISDGQELLFKVV